MLPISKNKLRNLLHGADCSGQCSAGLCSAAVKTGRGQLSRVFRAAAALKIVMVSIVEGREEVLLQAGDLSTIFTISDPHETERQ